MNDGTIRRRGRPRDASLGQRRHNEILDVAAHVFAKQGYRNTDVQVIADAVGVGKGTIYRYFATKKRLFLSAVDRGMQRMQEAVDAAVESAEEPQQRIAISIRVHLEFFEQHPEFVELLIQERAVFKDRDNPTFSMHLKVRVARWREVLKEQMMAGRVRPMSTEKITTVASNLIYGTMFTTHFFGKKKPPSQEAEDIIELIFYGILNDAERHRHPPRQDSTPDSTGIVSTISRCSSGTDNEVDQ